MNYLELINERLKEKCLHGEICLFGGAVMCLVFQSRDNTKDVDAVFAPTSEMYTIIKNIADEYRLPGDWLNPAVKGYVSKKHDIQLFQKMSNLTIYAASARYLLAMKCLAARGDTRDAEDIRFLLRHLKITKLGEALKLLEEYYPHNRVLPRTQYLLTEILDS